MLIAVHKNNQCCSKSKTSLDTVYLLFLMQRFYIRQAILSLFIPVQELFRNHAYVLTP